MEHVARHRAGAGEATEHLAHGEATMEMLMVYTTTNDLLYVADDYTYTHGETFHQGF